MFAGGGGRMAGKYKNNPKNSERKRKSNNKCVSYDKKNYNTQKEEYLYNQEKQKASPEAEGIPAKPIRASAPRSPTNDGSVFIPIQFLKRKLNGFIFKIPFLMR